MSATFETYFSLVEINQRIPKTAGFWRAQVKCGALGAFVVKVGGEFFVPASSIAAYLDARTLGAAPLAALFDAGKRQAVPGRFSTDGTPARSPGELRRKLA